MSDTTNKRLRELEQQQKELDAKKAIEKSKQRIVFSKEELKTFYLDSLKESPQILIETVVKKVVLYDDSVTIYFNNPIAASLDESQDLLLYEKQTTIPFYDKFTGLFRYSPFNCKISA